MACRALAIPSLALALAAGLTARGQVPGEIEVNAALAVPYRTVQAARTVHLLFQRDSEDVVVMGWKLELLDEAGRALRAWHGERVLAEIGLKLPVHWDGRDAEGQDVAPGNYTLRMTSTPLTVDRYNALPQPGCAGRVAHALAEPGAFVDVQEAPIQVGRVASPKLEPFRGLFSTGGSRSVRGGQELASPATAGLPYTVYYGNLHSHTNHSDGGAAVATCGGSEVPQGGAFGPSDAYAYMKNTAQGDFLLTSEHNHMYDGSTGTNTSADPAAARALFESGLAAAASFNSAHPGFLALYGMEWGTLATGAGHLNILNPDGLAGWETNTSGQVFGHYTTPKADHAALYTFMKGRNWVGQFNHPSSSQFTINGTGFGYTADGEEVMALCEVLNSKAFSVNTTETETSRSTYTSAWNVALERGYRVSPTSDQDNHCANWGMSYGNRTGVLIPTGIAITPSSFLEAVKARRTFATEDKGSQIVLTANGHLMGERFTNSGSLTLTVNHASSTGRTASTVTIFEGVPGRNGTVTQLVSGQGTHTFTPAEGKHFYYAAITQDDGNRLWSAPVWVEQGAGGDTQAPTASATESGTSGTITLNATATDNVGVTKVEFYVDGVLKGTDTAAPYTMALDSTTLANGSHTLTAKAFDAAGNVGTSAAVAFSVSNVVPDTQAPTVSATESGTSGTITLNATATDNVGVTKVEFYVDGVLKGTDTAAPYTMALDSTTLANGSHTLVAKAYDAAGNVGTSTTLTFSISNAVLAEKIVNGGFESGATVWTASSGTITNNTGMAAHGGTWKAWLCGYGSTRKDYVSQAVTIPSTATQATFSFWVKITTKESGSTVYDTLKVTVRNGSNAVLKTLATYSNANANASYVQKSFDLLAYKGQTIRVDFEGNEDSSLATNFVIDDVSVQVK